MLSFLRKNAGTWLIKVILGSIVVVFIFWGVGSFRSGNAAWVAKINGQPISAEQYSEAYNNLIQRYRSMYGQQLNEEMIKAMNLKQAALNQLIEKQLMLHEASRLQFTVSNQELVDSIREMPIFQENGVFDERRYRGILTQNRFTPETFENMQRELLLAEKLKSFVLESVHVSETEIQEWYNFRHETVQADYVFVDPARFSDLVISNDELKTYYNEHREEFKTPPQRTARYIEFTSDEFRKQVAVGEEEIQEYYESHLAEFEKPKTVKARHILVRLAQDAPADSIEKARKKALEIRKTAIEGKDFAELAKQHSDDPGSKEDGGNLGEFRKEDMLPAFSEAAFSMQEGAISEPVRTQFGFHIIKLEKINEAEQPSLQQASDRIRTKLTDERAANLAFDRATAVSEKMLDTNEFERIARENNSEIRVTPLFPRTGPPGFPNSAKFAEAAFSLEQNQISDVIESGNGRFVILQVVDIVPETIPEMEVVSDKVRSSLLKSKQEKRAAELASEILEAMKQGKSISEATAKKPVQTGKTGFFERSGNIPEIGSVPEVSKAAFELSSQKPVPDAPIKGRKGYYIIRLSERKKADPSGMEREKDQILRTLKSHKQNQAIQKLLDDIRRNSDIQISPDFT